LIFAFQNDTIYYYQIEFVIITSRLINSSSALTTLRTQLKYYAECSKEWH